MHSADPKGRCCGEEQATEAEYCGLPGAKDQNGRKSQNWPGEQNEGRRDIGKSNYDRRCGMIGDGFARADKCVGVDTFDRDPTQGDEAQA